MYYNSVFIPIYILYFICNKIHSNYPMPPYRSLHTRLRAPKRAICFIIMSLKLLDCGARWECGSYRTICGDATFIATSACAKCGRVEGLPNGWVFRLSTTISNEKKMFT